MKKGKPKQPIFDWPDFKNSPVHVRKAFRTLGSKKLKGEARKRKLEAFSDSFR